jgi:hypothetical protein
MKSCVGDESLLHLQQICSKISPSGCNAHPARVAGRIAHPHPFAGRPDRV